MPDNAWSKFAFLATKLEIDIPDNLTAKSAQYLSGGITKTDISSNLNFDSITKGELQRSIEDSINNHIPAKASALLSNANLQRSFIQVSNLAFGWDCYPAKYGSNSIYIPAQNALAAIPAKPQAWDGFDCFFDSLDKFAQDNKGVRFIVYLAADREFSPYANPSVALISDFETLNTPLSRANKSVQENSNIEVETNYYSYDTDSFYKHYYNSDLHWNIYGALDASDQIASHFNQSEQIGYQIAPLYDAYFTGTEARNALFLVKSGVFEMPGAFSNLKITHNDGQITYGDEHLKYDMANSLQKHYDFYGMYYYDIEESVITGGYGTATTLLVADSFGSALERPLANSSKTLYHSGLLRRERTSDERLSTWISNERIDTVVFVGRIKDFETFIERNPSYFD